MPLAVAAGGPIAIALAAGAAAIRAYNAYQARIPNTEPPSPPPVLLLADGRAEQQEALRKELDERSTWLDERFAALRKDQRDFEAVKAHTKAAVDSWANAKPALDALQAGQTDLQTKLSEVSATLSVTQSKLDAAEKAKKYWKVVSICVSACLAFPGAILAIGKLFGYF